LASHREKLLLSIAMILGNSLGNLDRSILVEVASFLFLILLLVPVEPPEIFSPSFGGSLECYLESTILVCVYPPKGLFFIYLSLSQIRVLFLPHIIKNFIRQFRSFSANFSTVIFTV
jgi:hypothetical protein